MERLRKVSSEEVFHELVVSQAGENLGDSYEEALEEAKKLNLEKKKELATIKDFPETYEELFNNEETEWFEFDLSPEAHFVNKIFDAGSGLLPPLGTTSEDLKNKYYSGDMSNKHLERLNKIRKNLSERPRAILLTTDFDTFVWYDGGHRTLAFMLHGRKIPAYVGMKKDFGCFKI